MNKNFRTYDLAKTLYRECTKYPWRREIRDQVLRSSLSVCLNLVEGAAKPTVKDRHRFYRIALGSLRETQACIELQNAQTLTQIADTVAAHLYCLCRSSQKSDFKSAGVRLGRHCLLK